MYTIPLPTTLAGPASLDPSQDPTEPESAGGRSCSCTCGPASTKITVSPSLPDQRDEGRIEPDPRNTSDLPLFLQTLLVGGALLGLEWLQGQFWVQERQLDIADAKQEETYKALHTVLAPSYARAWESICKKNELVHPNSVIQAFGEQGMLVSQTESIQPSGGAQAEGVPYKVMLGAPELDIFVLVPNSIDSAANGIRPIIMESER
jgi:hypothetical protein